MNKFEQLIEFVINDEEAKARELFHDIVVEKSRQIYEEMMQEEEDIDEGGHMGGSPAADLIDDVEVEEQGLGEEDMDMDMEINADDDKDDAADDDMMADADDLEDRVVDLEDKLDELMAEFEALMGDEGGMGGEEEIDMEVGDDMDSEEVIDTELETEGMMEAVNLKAAPAPVKSEEAGVLKKSPVAANAGAKGPVGNTVKPTNLDQGGEANGRPAPTTRDLIGDFQNKAGASMKEPRAAVKPELKQAAGVNTKSILKQV